MNLSAPFISQFYPDLVERTTPYWDIIIGNQEEAAAYVTAFKLDLVGNEAIAKHISGLPKVNTKRPRIVILTHGSSHTTISIGGADAFMIPVLPVSEEEIVDTNGCGDAFVGGLLSELVQGSDVKRAVEVGHWLASKVIKMSGAQYPSDIKLDI